VLELQTKGPTYVSLEGNPDPVALLVSEKCLTLTYFFHRHVPLIYQATSTAINPAQPSVPQLRPQDLFPDHHKHVFQLAYRAIQILESYNPDDCR
jgi:hypothetical protein